jgi:hypothetical protein
MTNKVALFFAIIALASNAVLANERAPIRFS